MTSQRPSIPKNLKNKLLVEANHVCTICSRPGVQLHHMDGDPTNNREDNLIVLCLAHHDEAEKSKAGRGLSSNLTPNQLREYKRRLKAGLRPTTSQTAPASSVSANVNNVDGGSTVIISAGDVSVTSPRIPRSEDYSLLERFTRSEGDLNDEGVPWRPQIDPSAIDEDERDMRYLDTLQDHASPDECAAWRRQLAELKNSLLLIEERLSEFVMGTDPANLQIVKRKRELERQIAELEDRLATQCVEDQEASPPLNSSNDDPVSAWREQLAIHRKNLSRLETQLAKYGIDAPLHLLNQIDDEKAAIERLETRIG